MRDLGLDHWVLKMESVTSATLISQFEELVRQQSTYRDYLGKVIPPYVARAESFQERLREVVASAQSETGSHVAQQHKVA
jgi:hypothetical protein